MRSTTWATRPSDWRGGEGVEGERQDRSAMPAKGLAREVMGIPSARQACARVRRPASTRAGCSQAAWTVAPAQTLVLTLIHRDCKPPVAPQQRMCQTCQQKNWLGRAPPLLFPSSMRAQPVGVSIGRRLCFPCSWRTWKAVRDRLASIDLGT